jgi:D-serine deaminase-like pyridoxal phosphate-dependent protein
MQTGAPYTVKAGDHVDSLDTPCMLVDLDVFESNVRACMDLFDEGRVRVRPHMKTAKSPIVAGRLLEAGAAGICVAKAGEAEVMLDAGIRDVLITTEIVGTPKLERFVRLLDRQRDKRVSVVVDSEEGAVALDAALEQVDARVDVLIEVNVAQDRCGVEPADAPALARVIGSLARLRLVGVQGYEGNLQHVRDAGERRSLCDEAMRRLEVAVDGVRSEGFEVPWVTTGGTGTGEFCARHEVVSEVQPGSFIFMDADYLDTDGLRYAPALTVLCTVISHPNPERAVVDAGLKSLSNDSGPARLREPGGWSYNPGGDEHGILTPEPTAGETRRSLAIGERLELIPSHIDTTVNLHDAFYAHRRGRIEELWPVAARGRVQ